MLVSELITYLLNAQAATTGPIVTCRDMAAICPASNFTAVGAAFATQGYFAQADVLQMLTMTDFGLWAPLLYIMSALTGMISLALGVPPKMYLWFFFGPAVYQFLLGTTAPAHGVEWRVATVRQDQRQVWRLAEPGLLNSNIVQRAAQEGNDGLIPTRFGGTREPVEVSYIFLWFDELISSTVQNMIGWTGVYNLKSGQAGPTSGIIQRDGSSSSTTDENLRWYLMSNLKWSMLDQITSARLHNGDLRDLFSTFLSSECGDALSGFVDKKAITIASNSQTGNLPCTTFRLPSGPREVTDCRENRTGADYQSAVEKMVSVDVPVPTSLRTFWKLSSNGPTGSISVENGSFPDFFSMDSGATCSSSSTGECTTYGTPPEKVQKITDHLMKSDSLNCADLLYFLVNGFRWEAGQIYYQLVSSVPGGMVDDDVIFNLFYGWNIRKGGSGGAEGELLNGDERRAYLQDLILIHLFRNEMAIAKKLVDRRFSSSVKELEKGADRSIAETGAKAKYGEVYTWALMIPYIQGVLLYLLAMAYPFACVLMVVPGWHKTLFTWMSFWAWVKIWDLGFSIVMVLERSIWSMLGSNSSAAKLASFVVPMQEWAKLDVSSCDPLSTGGCPVIPHVWDAAGSTAYTNIMRIFDRSLVLGSAMDIDVANAYYIYIMAALYFAIPAVTGQLVLGAKAGAASMVSGLMQGAQNDGSGGAKSSFTGALRNIAGANAATVGQDATAKAYRNNGLAAQAIGAGNAGLQESLAGAQASAMSQGLGHLNQNRQAALGTLNAARGVYGAGSRLVNQAENMMFADRMLDSIKGAGAGAAPSTGANPSGASPTGAPTGAAGGPTGATPTGGAGQMLGIGASAVGGFMGKHGDKLMKLGHQGWSIAQGMNSLQASQREFGSEMLGYAASAATNMQSAGATAQQAGLGIAGFAHNMAQQGHGMQERRVSSQAGFAAENSAWQDRRDFANQTSGYLSALGVDSSVVGPGNKPTDMMGMAMSGMLGSSIKSSANFASSGGAFWTMSANAQSQLNSSVGQQQVWGAYQHTSPTQVMAGVSAASSAWGGLQAMNQKGYQPDFKLNK